MARTQDVKLASRPTARPVKVEAPRRFPAVVDRVSTYLREVRIELSRVDWPTRTELMRMSIVVLVVLVVMAVYLGIFDYVYTVVIKRWLLQQTVR
ncbi:MAG: preprotein translocase subunit SecE [Armatimonadota bacterium]|nr:preprotein translocase subunit SecE [Armatimonadota bacterium]